MERTSFIAYPIRAQGFHLETPSFSPAPLCKSHEGPHFLGQINDRVANREWLAGDDYSIADIATFPWGEYIDRHGFDQSNYPGLMRWRERINGRPAVQRAKAAFVANFGAPSAQAIGSATSDDLDRFFGRSKDMPQQDFSAVTRMK